MRRILIIGNPGSGKSTLARALGEKLGLEVIHLDRHFWKPGWVLTPVAAWIEKVGELVSGESWIIDGNFGRTLDIRLERADGVIWLDFPRVLCLYRCFKRLIKDYGRTRPDLAPGCPEKFDWQFYRFVWTFKKHEWPIVAETLRLYNDKVPVLHLKSPSEVRFEKILEFVE